MSSPFSTGERQCENHEIRCHFSGAAGSLECDLVSAVRGFDDPRQAVPQPDGIVAKEARDRFGQLLIAAADVELLV